MRRFRVMAAAVLAAGLCLLAGCGGRKPVLNPKSPSVITLWHAYNAFAKAAFDQKIDEFNDTVGKEKGIIVEAYGFGNSDELNSALYDSANHIIGSDPLPNLFIAYPDSAYRLDQIAPLMELDQYFSSRELELYRPEFLAEGIWEEGASPKMLPVAKSTELLFLNGTDFDRFSRDTGVTEEDLATWEGMAETARVYYEWSGGQAFLGINGFNDFMVMSAVQLGTDPFQGGNGEFTYPRETALKAWEICYVPHMMGWYKSSTFNQDGVKSGKLQAYIGSSAGAGYFPSEVIVNETRSYPVECRVLPYPTFQGRDGYMTQRGANMCAFASDPVHELAAAEFMKWFTQPGQNIEFAISTGYIPVEQEALLSLSDLIRSVQDGDNRQAVEASVSAAVTAMEREAFYVKKVFPNSYEADGVFSESLWNKISMDLEEVSRRVQGGEDWETAVSWYVGQENFQIWYDSLLEEISDVMNGDAYE